MLPLCYVNRLEQHSAGVCSNADSVDRHNTCLLQQFSHMHMRSSWYAPGPVSTKWPSFGTTRAAPSQMNHPNEKIYYYKECEL